MSNEASGQLEADEAWRWCFQVSPENQRRRLMVVGGFAGTGLICLAIAAVSASRWSPDTTRFMTVLGLILLALLALAEIQTKRAKSTMIKVNRMGQLTFTDSRSTSSVDLRASSSPSVRQRSNTGGWQWSIEVNTPDGGWHREIANVATYFQMPETETKALEAELQHWHSWARSGQTPARTLQGGTASPKPATLPATTTPGQFHWIPPRHPNADRNRRRLRIGVGGFALLVAVLATVSQWKNGLAAVGFSMLTPVIILLVGAGLDVLFRSGQGFAIDIHDGLLTISRGRGEPVVVPVHYIRCLSVDVGTSSANVGGTTSRSTIWKLSIQSDQDPSKPDPLVVVIPTGFGTGFNTDEAIKLEASLRGFLSQI